MKQSAGPGSDYFWRKSTRSEGQTQCVQVADLHGHPAARDSGNPARPALISTAHELSNLRLPITTGRLDR